MFAVQGGAILARKDWSLHKRLVAADEQGKGPQAQVFAWQTQVQLAALILDAVGLSPCHLGH